MKLKKGQGEGISAYLIFGAFILIAQIAFQASIELEWLTPATWLIDALWGFTFTVIGILIGTMLINNLVNQGKKKGEMKW